MSLLVRDFDNLRSDVSLVPMDVPSKMAWIWMKQWLVQIWTSQDRAFERGESCVLTEIKIWIRDICNRPWWNSSVEPRLRWTCRRLCWRTRSDQTWKNTVSCQGQSPSAFKRRQREKYVSVISAQLFLPIKLQLSRVTTAAVRFYPRWSECQRQLHLKPTTPGIQRL